MDLLDAVELETPAVFNPREFSVPLIWNGTLTVECIFDDAHIAVEGNTGALVSSREPQAIVHMADLPALAVGDTVTIQGEELTVRDIQRDGTQAGDAILDLSV